MKASTSAIVLLSAGSALAGPLRLRQMPATPCSTTSDCQYGQQCETSVCVDYQVPDTGYSCRFNEDCPQGYECNRTQQCVPQNIFTSTSTTTTPVQPTSTTSTVIITVTPTTRPPVTVTSTVSKTTTVSSSSSSVSSSHSSSASSSASASSSRPVVVTSTSTMPYVPPSHIPNSGAGRLAIPAAGLALLASCALLL